MPYTLIIREEAVEEVKQAYLYYEGVQEGLGERFLSELQKRYSEISVHPQFYGFIDNKKSIRDIRLRYFPYQVIYEIMEDTVVVFSVFNSYQDPSRRNIK
jgi:hypothetical protein